MNYNEVLLSRPLRLCPLWILCWLPLSMGKSTIWVRGTKVIFYQSGLWFLAVNLLLKPEIWFVFAVSFILQTQRSVYIRIWVQLILTKVDVFCQSSDLRWKPGVSKMSLRHMLTFTSPVLYLTVIYSLEVTYEQDVRHLCLVFEQARDNVSQCLLHMKNHGCKMGM